MKQPGHITGQHCAHCQQLRTAVQNALAEIFSLNQTIHQLREEKAYAHTELVREQEENRRLRAELGSVTRDTMKGE